MLVPKKLTIKAIGRFVDSQTVIFDDLGSLTQLDAVVVNTGGSSGGGKSTLIHALEYNLGICDLPTSILQSRLTKEGLYTLGEYDLDGVPVSIERGKSKFSVTIGGEVTSGSSKLTEEKLDSLLGMPRSLFKRILHKPQGSRGFFLEFAPSEVHKFLTNCLGLEKEQSKIVILDTRLESLSYGEASIKSSISALQMASEATQSAIASLGLPPILEIDPGVIETLKIKHLEAISTHLIAKDGFKAEMDEFEKSRPKINTIPFDRSHIENVERQIDLIAVQIAELEKLELNRQSIVKSKSADLRVEANRLASVEQTRQSEVKAKISALQNIIRDIESAEKVRQAEVQSKITLNTLSILRAKTESVEGNKAKEAASNLAKELQKVRAALCPTCEQGWINNAAKIKECSLLESIQKCKALVIAGMNADKELVSLEEAKTQLYSELQPLLSPQAEEAKFEIHDLEFEAQPRPIHELNSLRAHMEQLSIEAQPQAIQEVIELKLKKDFKDKELQVSRQEERNHQSQENARNQVILAEFAQKQTALRQSHEITLKYVRDEEAKALAEYESARNKALNFEEAKKRYDESRNKLEDQALKYADQLIYEAQKLGSTAEEIELATESKKAIKSYLSCSFEDALDSIGDQATRLIRAIPNMSTATISFEGLKENKDGKVKEEVTCSISMDGEIGIPVKSLSGGERSSTDLAIDLAVIKFIEERTGNGIDLMILDEPFTGLDTVNVIEALEMLKECSSDKRLLIVDHNQIATQTIDSKIIVTRTGLTSTIAQQ